MTVEKLVSILTPIISQLKTKGYDAVYRIGRSNDYVYGFSVSAPRKMDAILADLIKVSVAKINYECGNLGPLSETEKAELGALLYPFFVKTKGSKGVPKMGWLKNQLPED